MIAVQEYKAFANKLDNCYGQHFGVWKKYSVSGPIFFGVKGNDYPFFTT